MKDFLSYVFAALFTGLFQWIGGLLRDQQGASNRNSALYGNYDVSKYVPDARDRHGRVVPMEFEVTIISATTGDSYNLFVLPAGWSVVGLFCTTNGIGTCAGSGITWHIGDAGSAQRFMVATDFDVANAQGSLPFTGVAYRPTADTIVVGVMTGAGVVGKIVRGHFLLVPPS